MYCCPYTHQEALVFQMRIPLTCVQLAMGLTPPPNMRCSVESDYFSRLSIVSHTLFM